MTGSKKVPNGTSASSAAVALPAGTVAKRLKIFIHPMDGAGHLNACLGMGQALAKRGHRIIFLMNECFSGEFARFGFEEIPLVRYEKTSKNPVPKDPTKGFAEQLLKSGFLSGASSLEKLKHAQTENSEDNFVQTMYDSSLDFNPQIAAAIEREVPDLIILDHFLVPPILQQVNIPWIFLFSGSPLCMYNSEQLPPFGSGYSAYDPDPERWAEFRRIQKANFYGTFVRFQQDLYSKFGYEPDTEVEAFACRSKYLNIYQYPEELDYTDVVPLQPGYARVDAFLRSDVDTTPFELPVEFCQKPGGDKLIYFSLGSMGSVDVPLMKRILSVLARTPYKYIVSKGPLADQYDLPENCWGESYLPQTRILPLVDLVITHGGNNTSTESFAHGIPLIVMPLFGDQYDTAQRIQDKGFGVRIDTYAFKDEQLIGALDRLLYDEELHQRLAAAKKRIESANSKDLLCQKIERVVQEFKDEQLGNVV